MEPSRVESTPTTLHLQYTTPMRMRQLRLGTPLQRRLSTMSVSLSISPTPTHVRAPHWKDDQPSGFKNPWPSAKENSLTQLIKFIWEDIRMKSEDAPVLPRSTVDFSPPGGIGIKATWLGHACVLVQFQDLNVIFDPVFEERCGPTYLAPRRVTDPGCTLSQLPRIDVVVLSHNHYDHLSIPSLRGIFASNPNAGLLMPLNTSHITRGIAKSENERELDWWESVVVEGKGTSLKFTATPAQHKTARTAWDLGYSLWCSWMVEADGGKVWFGGDTGYAAVEHETYEIDDSPTCPAFREIGERFGGVDMAFIPIGAYASRSFLSTVHCAPIDSVRVFRDIRAKKAFGIHWGTWDLSHEPMSEPPRMLAEAREKLGISQDEFDVIAIGGSVEV